MQNPFSAEGRYLNLAEVPGGLDVSLTDEGREELIYNRELYPEWSDTQHFYELFEDFLCNGWDAPHAEELGALTGCEIFIAPDAERNEDGELVAVDTVYWHERYAVEDFAEQLLTEGHCRLLKA